MNNLIVKFAFCALIISNGPSAAQAADYSVGGVAAGSLGFGASFSTVSNWSLVAEDQLQFRVTASGIAVNNGDNTELNNTDYEGDSSTTTLQGSVDWYPLSSKYTDRFFLSTGLVYFDSEFDGTSKANQSSSIGDLKVTPEDNVRINTEIEHSSLAPYVSIGWGDRIRGDSGLSFRAELGLLMPLSEADVDVTTTAPSTVVSPADLAKEKSEIENDFEGAMGYASLGVTYQF